MKDKITVDDLDNAIAELLDSYSEEVRHKVYFATKETVEKLVKFTKERAPRKTLKYKSKIRKEGTFARRIASIMQDNGIHGSKGIWYVKSPDYRLTHLIVHGHQLRNGGRAQGNDFLEKSVEEASRDYLNNLAKELEE